MNLNELTAIQITHTRAKRTNNNKKQIMCNLPFEKMSKYKRNVENGQYQLYSTFLFGGGVEWIFGNSESTNRRKAFLPNSFTERLCTELMVLIYWRLIIMTCNPTYGTMIVCFLFFPWYHTTIKTTNELHAMYVLLVFFSLSTRWSFCWCYFFIHFFVKEKPKWWIKTHSVWAKCSLLDTIIMVTVKYHIYHILVG